MKSCACLDRTLTWETQIILYTTRQWAVHNGPLTEWDTCGLESTAGKLFPHFFNLQRKIILERKFILSKFGVIFKTYSLLLQVLQLYQFFLFMEKRRRYQCNPSFRIHHIFKLTKNWHCFFTCKIRILIKMNKILKRPLKPYGLKNFDVKFPSWAIKLSISSFWLTSQEIPALQIDFQISERKKEHKVIF